MSILIKNPQLIATFNGKDEILRDQSIFIENNLIKDIDTAVQLTRKYRIDEIVDATDKIVLPGFINNHHHLFQGLFRNVPLLQNKPIQKWIAIMCALTKSHTNDSVYYAAQINLAELMLSGCTTTSDLMYIFPNNQNTLFESNIQSAHDIGIRFYPYRGSILKQKNNLFPDEISQTEDEILDHTEKMIKKYNKDENLMLKIGAGPCTLFSTNKKIIKKCVELKTKYNILLQTHVSESVWENNYCKKYYNKTPTLYLTDLEFCGKNTSFVHFIYPTKRDMAAVFKQKTNIIHCPISNARGEAVAPITELLQKNINVGIGVDGSAGNDSSNILTELRFARTLQGVRKSRTYLDNYQSFKLGNVNGAKILNLEKNIGSIEKNKLADIAIFDPTKELNTAGALANPLGSLISCDPIKVDTLIINGQIKIKNKKFIGLNLDEIVARANYYSQEVLIKAGEKLTKQGILKTPKQIFAYN